MDAPDDPDKPNRQELFLRALRTIPNLEIMKGRFATNTDFMRLADDHSKTVRVLKTEEKGSDVNLAARMIHEAHKGEYESAVLVSNDSDFVEATRIVTQELKLPVILLCPAGEPNRYLREYVTSIYRIRQRAIRLCQFPDELEDAAGKFHKPPSW